MESSTAFPGNTGQNPNSVAPLAEMLRLNGYSTGAFGKWHETAAWETSVSGPFDRWPTHQGFDKFYGFIGGETDQWYPLIYDGVIKVDPPKMKDYHFTVDMTNQAINWVKAQQSMTPDKPFFVYYATGAVHAPHHVPKEWADKYKGQFDKGWDQVRNETLERQKKLGVVPANTQLADQAEGHQGLGLAAGRPAASVRAPGRGVRGIPRADRQRDRPVREGARGHRRDGQHAVHLHRRRQRHQRRGRLRRHVQRDDLLQRRGREGRGPHPADRQVGRSGNLPAHGRRLGGGLRHALHVDQAGGVRLRRHPQRHGHSLAEGHQGARAACAASSRTSSTSRRRSSRPPACRSPRASTARCRRPSRAPACSTPSTTRRRPERHKTQYFEMFGNRAIYNDGWLARTIHRAPWQTSNLPPLTTDVWDLYDVRNDFSLTKNLAAEQPAKLKEMQALFMKEAEKYHVLPIDDRTIERMNPATRGPAGCPGRPHVAHALRGDAGHDGKHLHEHQEPLEQDHRGARYPGRRRQRRDPVAGRALRRLVAVHEGRQAGLHLQLPRAGALHRRRPAGAAARSRNGHARLRLRRRRTPARVARRRST